MQPKIIYFTSYLQTPHLGSDYTSIWVVQDHQFSMGFSDFILVGCGTEETRAKVTYSTKPHFLHIWMHSECGHTWHLKQGQLLSLSFLAQIHLCNILLQMPETTYVQLFWIITIKKCEKRCPKHIYDPSGVSVCILLTVLGKLCRACFTWGSICFMACMA